MILLASGVLMSFDGGLFLAFELNIINVYHNKTDNKILVKLKRCEKETGKPMHAKNANYFVNIYNC